MSVHPSTVGSLAKGLRDGIAGASLSSRVLFFLILSGPPKFRLRDPNASLEGTIDWVVLLHLIVWCWAGLWVFCVAREHARTVPQTRLSILEKLTLAFIGALGISVFFSAAPAFSAFKVYQLAITVWFITTFLNKYGVSELFENLFLGCGILAVADVIAAVVMPDLVFVESELGMMRFRGDLIAQTGIVSLIGLFLLLTIKSDLPKIKFLFWLSLFGGVLVASLMRTSYLTVLVVLFLAAIRRPAIPVLRKITVLAMASIPLLSGMLLSALDSRRQAEDLWTLSDRVGLWAYLIDAVSTRGPLLGLGYFAASRVYAPEYNPGLGTAHSAFIEVLVGGGLLSLSIFLCIWFVLAKKVWKLYLSRPDRFGFAYVALFCAALTLNAVGGELEAEPAGFCFWCLVVGLSVVGSATSSRLSAEA